MKLIEFGENEDYKYLKTENGIEQVNEANFNRLWQFWILHPLGTTRSDDNFIICSFKEPVEYENIVSSGENIIIKKTNYYNERN